MMKVQEGCTAGSCTACRYTAELLILIKVFKISSISLLQTLFRAQNLNGYTLDSSLSLSKLCSLKLLELIGTMECELTHK